MDYKEYWEMCRRISLIREIYKPSKKVLSEQWLTKKVPQELWVTYEGINYYPLAYEVRWHEGQPYRRAILHDLKADSLTYGDLDRVEVFNGVQ